jgi:predicted nucleic acid-binding protein
LDLAANRVILMFISPPVLTEYEAVLRRSRFKIDPSRIARSMAVIRKTSRLVRPTQRITEAEDEPDNRFLECAVAAGADLSSLATPSISPTDSRISESSRPGSF